MSTPMLTQVAALKREAGDAILFTRMGDFFELHGEDAVKAAPVMEIALTLRGRGTEFETPMCGVPHFALETYLPKLLAAGYSAAIADPTAKPEEVKGEVGHAAHGRLGLRAPAPQGQGDLHDRRGPHGVLAVQFVEVAHAGEEDRVAGLALEGRDLREHGGGHPGNLETYRILQDPVRNRQAIPALSRPTAAHPVHRGTGPSRPYTRSPSQGPTVRARVHPRL